MKIYFILSLLLIPFLIIGQDSIIINGEIKERFGDNAIGNAQIFLLPKNKKIVSSSSSGFFEFKVPFQKK